MCRLAYGDLFHDWLRDVDWLRCAKARSLAAADVAL
jgi:hypothetical protein